MIDRRRRESGLGGADDGAASIWVLACSALVLVVGIAVSLRTSAVLARHRAESAADLAALAAAAHIGFAADVCPPASSIARANGAALVRCHAALAPDARSGVVDVEVVVAVNLPGVGARRAVASARAGRMAVGWSPAAERTREPPPVRVREPTRAPSREPPADRPGIVMQ
jgi:secretion/DNA translocation related TadE-like protein